MNCAASQLAQFCASQFMLRDMQKRCRAGAVRFFNVVVTQTTFLSADNMLIGIQSRRLRAHIVWCKALGGCPL
jgi:outer membrane protein TolC